jgi:hypothetical protein
MRERRQGLHYRDRQHQPGPIANVLQELALADADKLQAGNHRDAQDRAEAADDPGAEERGGALRQRSAMENLPPPLVELTSEPGRKS